MGEYSVRPVLFLMLMQGRERFMPKKLLRALLLGLFALSSLPCVGAGHDMALECQHRIPARKKQTPTQPRFVSRFFVFHFHPSTAS